MKNSTDELLYEHPSLVVSPAREIFAAAEREIAEEDETVDTGAEVSACAELDFGDVEAADEEEWSRRFANGGEPHGDVNKLHAAYVTERDATDGSLRSQLKVRSTKDKLVVDVHNYALRLFAKQGQHARLNGIDGEDVAQGVAQKVFVSVDSFSGKSHTGRKCKFSTWVGYIFFNYQTELIRQSARRGELPLNDESFQAVPSGKNVHAAGAAPESHNPDDEHDDSEPSKIYSGEADGARAPSGGSMVYSPAVAEAEANKVLNAVAVQQYINNLSEHEQAALRMMAEGYGVAEIVEKLKLKKPDARKLYRLREQLRKQYESIYDTAGVVLHTCRLVPSEQPSKLIVGYIENEDGTFKRMELMCRCRKKITLSEASALVENGEAQHILRLNRKGEVVPDYTRIWAAQALQVPRGGMRETSGAGMQRAAGGHRSAQRDIQIANELTLAERRKLVVNVPADKYDRVEQEQSGRAVMLNYMPTGRHQDGSPIAPSEPSTKPRPDKVVSVAGGGCHLAIKTNRKCTRKKVTTSVYPDGSKCISCACGSLWVGKAPGSSVIDVKADTTPSTIPVVPTEKTIPEAGVIRTALASFSGLHNVETNIPHAGQEQSCP